MQRVLTSFGDVVILIECAFLRPFSLPSSPNGSAMMSQEQEMRIKVGLLQICFTLMVNGELCRSE